MMLHFYQLLKRPVASQRYLPEVDGIRFLAISLVVLQHIKTQFDFQWYKQHADQVPYFISLVATNGYNGVRIFFALSGFILSLPFIKWHTQAGNNVSLISYYKRRIFRLEPPYFVALTLALIWQVLRGRFALGIAMPHYFASFFYLHNILYDGFPLINGITWSLEIELQFYLLAPLLFRVFRLSANIRRYLIVSAIFIIIALHQLYRPPTLTLYQYLHLFLTGMLVADFYMNGWPSFTRNKWLTLLIIPALYFVIRNPAIYTFPVELLLCAALFISFALVFTQPVIKRVFSWKWFTVIGGMCYSIYLVHYPLLQGISRYYQRLFSGSSYGVNFVYSAVFSIVVILIVSIAFFLMVEKPFMNRRVLTKG